jgi:hypothetical protein
LDIASDIDESADQIHGLLISDHVLTPIYQHRESSRRKRQVSWDSDETDQDDATLCVLTCAMQFREVNSRFQNVNTGETFGDNGLVKSDVNMTRFTEICEAFRPPLRCFDRCPYSSIKEQLKSSLDPIRYMCVDRFQDIKNNARCMQKLAPDVNTQCKPRCRQYEDALTRIKRYASNPIMRRFYSNSDVRDMLEGTCHYIQCHVDCSVPVTRRVCGETAADLTKGVIQRLMASVQNLSSMTGSSQYLPLACRRLANADEEEERQAPAASSDDDTDYGRFERNGRYQNYD